MPSYFREMFSPAFAMMFDVFADHHTLVTYTDSDGTPTFDVPVIWRAETIETTEDSQGNAIETVIAQCVFSAEQLPTIDWEATIERDGYTWDVDAREGRGIEADNSDFAIVHVIRRGAIARTGSGKRME